MSFLQKFKDMFRATKPGVEKAVRNHVPATLRGNDNVEKAIGIGVVILVSAIVIGYIALPIFFNTNTTGWDATVVTVWNVLPVLAIVAILFIFIAYMRHKGSE